MLYLNLYSLPSLLLLLVLTSQLGAGIRFAVQYPSFVVEALAFSLCSALGQSCVLFTLLTFDSLVLVTVTTTRKFASVLLSVALYGHHLSAWQWAGVGLVWLGLSMDVYAAWSRQSGAGDGETSSRVDVSGDKSAAGGGRMVRLKEYETDTSDYTEFETEHLVRKHSTIPEVSESDTN